MEARQEDDIEIVYHIYNITPKQSTILIYNSNNFENHG